MKYRTLILFVVMALLTGKSALAHHSLGATYDGKKEVKLDGKLVEFSYRNPHSFVSMEAPDEQGTMHRWALEWSGAGALGGQGVNRETLRVGDHIVVTGNPSRVPGEFRAKLNTLKRPSDGFSWGTLPGQVVD